MTRRIEGSICTPHAHPECVAGALSSDNLSNMRTQASGGMVRTDISADRLRSVVASVDDYLMNLAIAEEMCDYVFREADAHETEEQNSRSSDMIHN